MYKSKYILIFLMAIIVFPAMAIVTRGEDNMKLILNMINDEKLPRNFRMTTYDLDFELQGCPSLTGLDQLKASGSGQFSEGALIKMLEEIPNSKVIVVDLREESHGFVNGIALSWYLEHNVANLNKPVNDILEDEKNRLDMLLKEKYAAFYDGDDVTTTLEVEKAVNEEALVEGKNCKYFRLPVTDHHRPIDKKVDQFIEFYKSLPKDVWLHFHCSAGKGRTSTFMVMYDMLRNAKDVALEDIMARQMLIGGKDFWKLPEQDSWKYDSMVDRLEFLKLFYRYCQESNSYETSWSAWVELLSEKEKECLEFF